MLAVNCAAKDFFLGETIESQPDLNYFIVYNAWLAINHVAMNGEQSQTEKKKNIKEILLLEDVEKALKTLPPIRKRMLRWNIPLMRNKNVSLIYFLIKMKQAIVVKFR